MPFAEVAGGVACLFESGGDGFFLKPQGVPVTGNAGAVVGPAGEDGGASRRTHGSPGVEAIEAQSIGRHGIEVGSLENGMRVVAGLPPSLIIGHDEDDVGLWAGLRWALSQEPRALE